MATRIRSTLLFDNIASHATATMVHGLNVDDTSVVPNSVVLSNANFSVVEMTAESLTVRNNTGGQLDCTARLRYWLVEHRRIAQNVLPPSNGTFARRKIYVRNTGSDTTGNGSLTHPYRTVAFAISTIPLQITNARYVIDCTDLGTESHAGGITLPPFQSNGAFAESVGGFDDVGGVVFFDGFCYEAPITIQAAPTVSITITPAQVTGVVAEPTCGLWLISTDRNYVVNTHRGKYLVDVNGNSGVIAGNTAGPNSVIEVTGVEDQAGAAWTPTAPFRIVTPSATLQNSSGAADGLGAINILGCNARVALNGIAFNHTSASTLQPSFRQINSLQGLIATMCTFKGIQVQGAAPDFGFDSNDLPAAVPPSFYSCGFTDKVAIYGDTSFSQRGCWYAVGSGVGEGSLIMSMFGFRGVQYPHWSGMIFDGVGVGGNWDVYAPDVCGAGATYNRFWLSGSAVRNYNDVGVFIGRYSSAVLDSMVIHDNQNGVCVVGGYVGMTNVRSILWGAPPPAGTNTNIGLQISQHGRACTTSDVDLAGATADLVVGSNVGIGWGTFRADPLPRNVTDDVNVLLVPPEIPQFCAIMENT